MTRQWDILDAACRIYTYLLLCMYISAICKKYTACPGRDAVTSRPGTDAVTSPRAGNVTTSVPRGSPGVVGHTPELLPGTHTHTHTHTHAHTHTHTTRSYNLLYIDTHTQAAPGPGPCRPRARCTARRAPRATRGNDSDE